LYTEKSPSKKRGTIIMPKMMSISISYSSLLEINQNPTANEIIAMLEPNKRSEKGLCRLSG
jgi:hypothetical protein